MSRFDEHDDVEAPILASADYAVIGDLHEVVPAIFGSDQLHHCSSQPAFARSFP